jgi:dienelactone hydrolase
LRGSRQALGIAAAALMLAASGAARGEDPPVGLQPDVAFTDYPRLAENGEIIRRAVSPLGAEVVRRRLAATGQKLAPAAVNPAKERFILYVPAKKPAAGYGLMVFVPPWPEGRLPPGWAPVLDQRGMIYVSSVRSGNTMNVLGRRVPMAMVAYANVVRRYPIDPARVYIGGFSGGSRVALRVALAYPEVFRGALLNASSDPIGTEGAAPPPADLWETFRSRSRIVFVTGSVDPVPRQMDELTERSLRARCVFDIDRRLMNGKRHDTPDQVEFTKAMASLESHAPDDPARAAACQAKRATELESALGRARAAIAAGDPKAARREIVAVDESFGGPAAAQVIELADRCGCGIFPQAK